MPKQADIECFWYVKHGFSPQLIFRAHKKGVYTIQYIHCGLAGRAKRAVRIPRFTYVYIYIRGGRPCRVL